MFDLVEGESKNYILETAGEQKGISEGILILKIIFRDMTIFFVLMVLLECSQRTKIKSFKRNKTNYNNFLDFH